MSTMNCFSAPDAAVRSTPIVALRAGDLAAYLATAADTTRAWVGAAGFLAAPATALLVPGADGHPALALAGIGDADDPLALAHLPLALPEGVYRLSDDAGSAIDPSLALLGWGLGAYQFDRYRKPARAPARLALDAQAASLADAYAQLKASRLVRDLVNTPTEDMGPDQLEAVVHRIASAYGGTVETVAGDALLQRNFPTIHAVGRASHRAPRLIELTWGDAAHSRLAIVGKGVCFDTGGLDIKPADGMRWMKKDMGGAAHAIALAQLVMSRKLPVRLQLLVPAVENAIGPNAFRPGEIIATRKGLRVEVDNTDAEGRLVLCDALTYAAEAEPALMLDFATLTGAARIALGPDLPALFCNDDALRDSFATAARAVRDPLWPMPLWQPYHSYLRSHVADLANSGPSRMAGAITAALYLERFVPASVPWAHVDTYSWNDVERPGKPAGGEAQSLRAAWAMLRQRFGVA
ncbi:leucyl aminopeptidase family protein [Chiayiivirga flava]|uniref:Leucyl aminopeptidase n=1 Tax=Chiayiivirga flava TaxID=659595 RepID=A0A7W8G3B1_9GAMM|nr:leucyl aminopeptidase family protein [Chiayiivirga flava]MBB5209630.1 leucyl aminopeptidase [Chiayiivirga flava]